MRHHATVWLALVVCALSGCQGTTAPPTQQKTSSTSAADNSAVAARANGAVANKASPSPNIISDRQGTATSDPSQLAVAAASDLRFVLPELAAEFERQHAGITITPTFGASGTLFAQISNHAPFDLFLAADVAYAERLVAEGRAQPDSLFRYAVGHIVLWAPRESVLPIEESGADVLRDSRVRKLAIANPANAPYGRAAESALKHLGLYQALQTRLVLGENVAQAAQFAESGAADLAIIGLSQATAPTLRTKGKYWKFPRESYPPLIQAGVIVSGTAQQGAAQKFCRFLQSSQAQAIFQKYGFEVPAESARSNDQFSPVPQAPTDKD